MTIEYRNAHYSENTTGMIDCEINHSELGWIPTSISLVEDDPDTAELKALVLAENDEEDLALVVRGGVRRSLTSEEIAEKQADELDEAKEEKLLLLSIEAKRQITKGFYSSALGSEHFYGSQETDQLNLIGSCAVGVDMPYPCRDSRLVWERKLHTNAELIQVAGDGALRKQSVLAYLDGLRSQIDGAATVADVEAVLWNESDYAAG